MYIAYYSPTYIQTITVASQYGINVDTGFWGDGDRISNDLTDLVPATFNMIEPLYHLVIRRGIFKVRRTSSSMYYDYHIPNFEKFDEILQYVEDKLY